jgi:hypothetical protein
MVKKEMKLMVADEVIISKIYFIRGQKVMIDRDLAELYHVTTGNLNKAVNRNLKRFPEDFMFQLNATEFKNLMFQNGISSWGGTRKLPDAFTDNGMSMLSGILNSDWAIEVNIRIMRVFTRIGKMLLENTELRLAIEKLEAKADNNKRNIELVFQYIDELNSKIDSQKSVTKPKVTQGKIGYKIPTKKKK